MVDKRTGTPIGRTLGIACDECKFVYHFYTGRPFTIKKLGGRNFTHCPLCGVQGHTIDNMNDVTAWEGAYALGVTPELYKTINRMYMNYFTEYRLTHVEMPMSINEWFKQTLKEAILSIQENE